MKLNPGEEVKYGAYWAEAVGEDETVGGKDAVAFLGRASKVSKGQLRRIWDIADHRKEAELDREQFYIALRLLALAQRGAELSIGGLRNFTGIQLIPNIDPLPKKAPAEPKPPPKPEGFSWTVAPEVVARYDSFFAVLDVGKAGAIDGKQGVTFFGKSGLPRPTLQKIWQLADVTRDGLLSLDEFRTAMHMVANIRNKRLTVTALPSVLDPNGPNWLRIEGQEPPPAPDNTNADQGFMLGEGMPMPPAPNAPPVVPAPPRLPSQGQDQSVEQSVPIAMPPPPSGMPSSPIAMQPPPSPQYAHNQTPQQMHQPLASMPSIEGHSQMAPRQTAAQDETEQMREALRQEQLKMEQTRREMEEMRAQMEQMRLQQMSLANSQSTPQTMAPPVQGNTGIPARPYPQSSPSNVASNMRPIQPRTPQKPPISLSKAPPQSPPIVLGLAQTASAKTPPLKPLPAQSVQGQGMIRSQPISLKKDDDDIWDQPSPKANVLPGPGANDSSKAHALQSKSSDSSDDDDDFWGGMGKKPTLGPAGGASAAGAGKDKGFGGSELDDWAF